MITMISTVYKLRNKEGLYFQVPTSFEWLGLRHSFIPGCFSKQFNPYTFSKLMFLCKFFSFFFLH